MFEIIRYFDVIRYNDVYDNIDFVDSFGHDGQLIFKAATTCYKSEATTTKSPTDFIHILKKNGHLSMIEMMWLPVKIEFNKLLRKKTRKNIAIKTYNIVKTSNYIECTYDNKDFNYIIVSGNARAWLQFFENALIMTTTQQDNKFKFDKFDNKIIYSICRAIKSCNPIVNEVFDDIIIDNKIGIDNIANIVVIDKNSMIPDEHAIHRWQFVKFKNVSRGFTHELVRHRTMSFAQSSTRYIDNSNFKLFFDFDSAFENIKDITNTNVKLNKQFHNLEELTENDFEYDKETIKKHATNRIKIAQQLHDRIITLMQETKELYSDLIACGVQKNHARQILPTGIVNEICVAGRIPDWEHLFKLRTSGNAHFEIRKLMALTQKIFKNNMLI